VCDFGGSTERVHLVGVSISLEKNFYRLPFTPPLSGRLIGPSAASASARRAAHRAACCAARRRLIRLCRVSGCLGTSCGSSHGSSRGSSSTTSPTPRVWVPRHITRLIACRRLLRLRHTKGCLGTSRGSSSTTSPTPRVWVTRHVAWPITRLIINYSVRRLRIAITLALLQPRHAS
jgi:hypothetical protein